MKLLQQNTKNVHAAIGVLIFLHAWSGLRAWSTRAEDLNAWTYIII